ncbi:MAG: LamG-like jellyroll fold domain-containing protein [Verrucomicrobiales bacterium]
MDADSKPTDFDRGKLVDLDATALPVGPLETWSNTGSTTGDFVAEVGVPEVQRIDEVNAVVLNGIDTWYVGPTAPPSVTGSEGSRTVEAWVNNPVIANEETVFAWGMRNGPDGSNTSFNHGSSPDFGAVGHWGGPDIGWNGTQETAKWTFIAYTWDADTATTTVYTNGEVANTEENVFLNTHAEDNIGDPLPFIVGNQNEPDGTRTAALSGSMAIARIRVHGKALDEATIKATYASEKGFFNADNDSDGLPNAYEAMFAFLDPNDAADAALDFDQDGLTALQEFEAGTNPGLKDSDADGIDDNAELTRQPAPTNPLLADSDQDGLQDGAETESDPLDSDSDGDGFIDGQEVIHGASATDAGSVPDFSNPVAVINLNAAGLADGELAVWPNTGAVVGDFEAESEAPGIVMEVDGRKGVDFDGSNWYVGPAAPLYLAPGEDDGGSRTVTAWVHNPDIANEETVFAWGRRNGPDGSNTSFNHGASADFGAVGHWGAPDIGWNGTEVIGAWTHIAYTWSAETETTNVYTDGELANTEEGILLGTWGQDTTNLPLPFVVGNQNEPDGTRSAALTASMTIAEIRVFDQALTAEQIVQDRDGELGNAAGGSFQIISVELAQGAAADAYDITVTWQSQPDKKYSVASNIDLQGEWTELSDGVDSDGETTSFKDTGVSKSTGTLYYRITLE